MSSFLYENHRGSLILTSLNVLGVLNVLNVLNVLGVLNVLNVLNMPMDALLACWALFFLSLKNSHDIIFSGVKLVKHHTAGWLITLSQHGSFRITCTNVDKSLSVFDSKSEVSNRNEKRIRYPISNIRYRRPAKLMLLN